MPDNQKKASTLWVRWAPKWNGHLQGDGSCNLPMFKTRRECREYIRERYGYIKDRPDLRSPPHNWRMPVAVRVQVKEIGSTEA